MTRAATIVPKKKSLIRAAATFLGRIAPWNVVRRVRAPCSLAQLNALTCRSGVRLWQWDIVNNSLQLSEDLIELCGVDPEEARKDPGELMLRFVHPDDRERLHREITAAIRNAPRFSIEHRVLLKDGSVRATQLRGEITRSAGGDAVHVLGIVIDMGGATDEVARIAAQNERQNQLFRRLKLATEAAGISVWEQDLVTGDFEDDGTFFKLFGLDPAPKFKPAHGIHEDERRDKLGPILSAAKDPGANAITLRNRTSNPRPEPQYVQTHIRVYRDAAGAPIRLLGVTWDVTAEVAHAAELERAVAEARAMMERLGVATQAAGVSPWEFDLVASRFSWCGTRLPCFGLDDIPLDEYRRRLYEIVVAADRRFVHDAARAAVASHSDQHEYTFRVHGVDGKIHHIHNYARTLRAADGTPNYLLGVSRDISRDIAANELLMGQAEENRRLIDQLLLAERRLERASLSSFEGHWEADLVTRQLWCSSSFHTVLGYRENALTPSIDALDNLIHADDHASYRAAWQDHIASNQPYDLEIRLRMAGGGYRWFRMRGMAERDADGSATVIAGSIQDIHQQKLIEDELRSAQARFERAINGTQDGLWEFETATNDSWSSPRLIQLLGYEQLDADALTALVHPEDLLKIGDAMRAHDQTDAPFDLEVRIKHASGEYRWYRSRAIAERGLDGKALRLSGSLQDVTDARAAREALLRATEDAQAASRAKSQFLANVSHEIRTPMNGIIGMMGLLQDTNLDRTQREYAETIRGSADSLLTVINDILDFSKIEAGKLDLECIEMDLRANIEDVGAMMAFQAASKGLELIVNVDPDVASNVLGDPQRLRQCVVNLVSNAIKFTQQGEIVITVRPERGEDGTPLVYFEVSDTGIGIAAETSASLFEPFVQADASTTRHFGGTGLGLSIVRRLVALMGGEVAVSSEVGRGSRFFFSLPLGAAEPIMPPAPVRSGATGKILVVDDNLTNRKVLCSLLAHADYRVAATGTAQSALLQLEAAKSDGEPFDMVITDYQMPEMDGATLGERIVGTPTLSDTRLVMLTSLDRQGDTPRLSALGFAAYLTKPVRGKELLQVVNKVMSGEPRQWQMDTQPMITRNTLAQAAAQQRFAGHVLLVEDNLVNQKVAARFLERLGCSVEVARNGAEGIAAATSRSFDIILMDLQMPVMDGLTATRRIREVEILRKTPIIALTANAMAGDRERCEAAGMDDYLTKPIEVERLRATLTKYGLALPEDAALRPPIDLGRLNELIAGDGDFARDLAAAFSEGGEQQLADMQRAAAGGDRDALAKAAHKLKGSCANIHAHSLHSMVQRLETDSETAAMASLEAGVARLRQEFDRARQFLNDSQVIAPAAKAAS